MRALFQPAWNGITDRWQVGGDSDRDVVPALKRRLGVDGLSSIASRYVPALKRRLGAARLVLKDD